MHKLAQREFKTKHDLVGKMIHWEVCKKFKFNHTIKWYMYNPESDQKNETFKILWDFEIQTDHLVSPRLPDQVIVKNNKKSKREPAELWTLPFRLNTG